MLAHPLQRRQAQATPQVDVGSWWGSSELPGTACHHKSADSRSLQRAAGASLSWCPGWCRYFSYGLEKKPFRPEVYRDFEQLTLKVGHDL